MMSMRCAGASFRLPSETSSGQRHPVIGHTKARQPVDTYLENAIRCRIDQTQPDVIPQPRLLRRQEGGHQVPQPTCCYEISAVEFHVELAGVIKPNVEEDGRDVLIHVWRGRFFDDQGAEQPAGDLFVGKVVGVIPVGSGIGNRKPETGNRYS